MGSRAMGEIDWLMSVLLWRTREGNTERMEQAAGAEY